MSLKKYLKDPIKARILECSPALLQVMCGLIRFCEDEKLPLVITSVVSTEEEDKALGRRSDTHRTGRAFDVRTRDWTDATLIKVINFLNDNFKHLGALGNSGDLTLVVDKSKTSAPHLHVQIHRKFSATI